jgi:hypothetical protein
MSATGLEQPASASVAHKTTPAAMARAPALLPRRPSLTRTAPPVTIANIDRTAHFAAAQPIVTWNVDWLNRIFAAYEVNMSETRVFVAVQYTDIEISATRGLLIERGDETIPTR